MGQTHLEDMLEVVNRLAFIPLAQQAIYDFNLENNSKHNRPFTTLIWKITQRVQVTAVIVS